MSDAVGRWCLTPKCPTIETVQYLDLFPKFSDAAALFELLLLLLVICRGWVSIGTLAEDVAGAVAFVLSVFMALETCWLDALARETATVRGTDTTMLFADDETEDPTGPRDDILLRGPWNNIREYKNSKKEISTQNFSIHKRRNAKNYKDISFKLKTKTKKIAVELDKKERINLKLMLITECDKAAQILIRLSLDFTTLVRLRDAELHPKGNSSRTRSCQSR